MAINRKIPVHCALDPETLRRADVLKKSRNTSLSDVIRDALRWYLDHLEEQKT